MQQQLLFDPKAPDNLQTLQISAKLLAQSGRLLLQLIILGVPKGPPLVTDVHQVFVQPGDWLSLNCTVAPSRPPTRLTWLVNGREV